MLQTRLLIGHFGGLNHGTTSHPGAWSNDKLINDHHQNVLRHHFKKAHISFCKYFFVNCLPSMHESFCIYVLEMSYDNALYKSILHYIMYVYLQKIQGNNNNSNIYLVYLPAITNILRKNAVIIAKSISVSCKTKRSHWIQKARSKSTKTTVAEAGILLNLLQFLYVQAQLSITPHRTHS